MIIELTQGQVAIVSDEDSEFLCQFQWHAHWNPNYSGGGAYMATRKENSRLEYLHRVVLSLMLNRPLLVGETADHDNRNPLDNTRGNIRLASLSQQQHNQGLRKNNTSGFKGVSWDKSKGKWLAGIWNKGEGKRLGRFDTPEEAAKAYDEAARELHGEFAVLNFP